MGRSYIFIWGEYYSMERKWAQRYGQENKENHDNEWRFSPKNSCRYDVWEKKRGGRGLICVERCVKGKENSLKVYMSNSKKSF